jgi:NADH-quinone oxidoreductase subunit M
MIIVSLIIGLMFAAALLWWLARFEPNVTRWGAFIILLLALGYFINAVLQVENGQILTSYENFKPIIAFSWIAAFNIQFALSLDYLSILLILLTLLLGLICVLVAWREIIEHVGFFYFNLLCTLAGIIGVFAASGLLLLFFFWELLLLPQLLRFGDMSNGISRR